MKSNIYLMLMLLAGTVRTAGGQSLVEPVTPHLADHNSTIFRLEIDTSSFQELAMYYNLRFEIDPHGRKFDPQDARETWKKIEIKKAADEPGFYVLTFSSELRKAVYRARPVFEEENYSQAVKTYEALEAEYRGQLETKRRDQQKVYEQFVVQAAALGGVDNLDERVSRYDSLAAATWERLQKLQLINIDPTDPIRDVLRGGGYHFDPPEKNYVLVPIDATYRDSAGHPMELTNVDVLFRGFEVMGFLEGKHISVAANGDNMIFGIWQKKLYVLPFEKYRQLHVGPATRLQTFTMQYVDTVYQDLRYYDLRNLTERYQQQHR